MPLLEVKDLHVAFGNTEILRGIDLQLEPGETLGIVGESGCGKSMTGLALMGLLPPGGKVTKGSISFEGTELLGLSQSNLRKLRGGDIAMIFQDPFTSLNPSMRVADQIAEAVKLHRGIGGRAAYNIAIEQLREVRVPAPESTARKYPHQLSGGQRQRVMIAIAFSCQPKLLIADEPTTALDVTLQAQILALIKELQQAKNTAVILISHDIGVIGSICDRISVFYAGRAIEDGLAADVLRNPVHPYTQGLLASLPGSAERLHSIPGQPPDFRTLGRQCSFRPRCSYKHPKSEVEPELMAVSGTHRAACWLVESPVPPNHEPEPVTAPPIEPGPVDNVDPVLEGQLNLPPPEKLP